MDLTLKNSTITNSLGMGAYAMVCSSNYKKKTESALVKHNLMMYDSPILIEKREMFNER